MTEQRQLPVVAKFSRRTALAALAGAALFPRTGRAETPTTIRIGFASIGTDNRPFAGGSPAAIAHAEHYIEKELADLPGTKIEWSFFKGAGPAVNEAFANGQLDFALQGDLPSIIGRANGLKTHILLASGAHAPIYLAVPDGSPIASVKALRGKKVSIFRGTNNHLAAVKVLAGYGLGERDLQVLNMDTATTTAALATKDIDAAFGNFPLITLQEQGSARIVYTTKGDNPAYERHSHVIASDAFVAAHPDLTQRLVTGFVKATRWSSDEANREAVLEIWARSGTPASVFRYDFDGQPLRYRNSPIIDPFLIEQYRAQARQAREFGLLRRDVDLAGWFDTQFLEASLKQLGLENHWQRLGVDGKPIG
jgi:sulfonate transport system substrate-binding protein